MCGTGKKPVDQREGIKCMSGEVAEADHVGPEVHVEELDSILGAKRSLWKLGNDVNSVAEGLQPRPSNLQF